MTYKFVRLALAAFAVSLVAGNANAGWGSLGGSGGGGGGGGSSGGSGGGFAGYGSGGGASYAGYASGGGGSGGGGGSTGYVASYGSGGGGSSGGVARQGIVSRIHERIHNHIAAKRVARASHGSSGVATAASYGSSGGGGSTGYSGYTGGGSSGGSSYAGGGSSGGSSVSYGGSTGYSAGSVSYGSAGSVSHGSAGSVSYGSDYSSGYGSAGSGVSGEVYYGTSTQTNETVNESVGVLASNVTLGSDAIELTVSVPKDAKVFVNGNSTTSTGSVRQFVSRGLEVGKSYRFEIRAELTGADGKVVTDSKELVVKAGDQEKVDFAALKTGPVETVVTLNVPADAKVTLAGNATRAQGSSRTFRTSQLKEGEVWESYTITVEAGGREKSQTIRLIGGDNLELSFNFDDQESRLASR